MLTLNTDIQSLYIYIYIYILLCNKIEILYSFIINTFTMIKFCKCMFVRPSSCV